MGFSITGSAAPESAPTLVNEERVLEAVKLSGGGHEIRPIAKGDKQAFEKAKNEHRIGLGVLGSDGKIQLSFSGELSQELKKSHKAGQLKILGQDGKEMKSSDVTICEYTAQQVHFVSMLTFKAMNPNNEQEKLEKKEEKKEAEARMAEFQEQAIQRRMLTALHRLPSERSTKDESISNIGQGALSQALTRQAQLEAVITDGENEVKEKKREEEKEALHKEIEKKVVNDADLEFSRKQKDISTEGAKADDKKHAELKNTNNQGSNPT